MSKHTPGPWDNDRGMVGYNGQLPRLIASRVTKDGNPLSALTGDLGRMEDPQPVELAMPSPRLKTLL